MENLEQSIQDFLDKIKTELETEYKQKTKSQ